MSTDERSQLEQLIRSSTLAQTQQEEFIRALTVLDDYWVSPILQLALEYPEVMQSLYKNLKAKQAAVASGDPEAWDKIMADEDEWLQRIDASTE